jgi:hypothetical protein
MNLSGKAGPDLCIKGLLNGILSGACGYISLIKISSALTAVTPRGSANISKHQTFRCHRTSASRLPTLSTGKLSESSPVAPVALLPSSILHEAERLLAYLVREKALSLFGDKPVPRGKLNQLIKEVFDENAEQFDGDGPLSIDKVRAQLKRGRKSKAK